MKTLLLVDGSSYLFRAFYALPDLRNRENEPTGAIFGVLKMLQRLHKDYAADYSACVFDAKGKTFRDDWYPQYKANRPPTPDDLVRQIPTLHQAIHAMGWPLLVEEGVEADDVIGTLARQAAAQGMRVVVSTGDKDLAQLVDSQITLVNTMTDETLDRDGVIAKFGVPPERIVDYLTLVGDSVDNVPGVAKVGPKTAVKWLQQYDSLDNIVQHAAEIGGVVGQNLRDALDWLPMAKKLVTVVCDLQLKLQIEELAHDRYQRDVPKLKEMFERLDFKAWRRELDAAAPAAEPEVVAAPLSVERRYEMISSEAQLAEWCAKLRAAPLMALDTETDSLDPLGARLVGLSFAVVPGHAAYLPLRHVYAGAPEQLTLEAVWQHLQPILEDATIRKVGQNLKFDRHVLANEGITLRGVAHDTLLQSYVLESHRPHDLGNLAERHLGLKTLSYDDVTGKGANRICFDQVELARATEYAAEDADITLQVHQTLLPRVQEQPGLADVYNRLELPAAEILFAIERHGVLLDSSLLIKQSQELGQRVLELERMAHELAGQPFNLGSPKQIQEVLFDRMGLPVKHKTPSGAPSTDEDALADLALDYPLPKAILEHRGMAKLKSTYTDKLPRMINPRTGRVHTTYSQATAVTGRLASSDPNLQNIPVRTAEGRRIREAFIAPAGFCVVSADYSQIELRIMAHLSDDPGLLHAFASGLDVHRATAAEVFGLPLDEVGAEQRRYAKAINFGLIYGMSAHGLAAQIGVDRKAAQSYIDRYFARYPGVDSYMKRTRSLAKQQGYVETVLGRRLWLPEINSRNWNRAQGAQRAAINAPMQGTAADIIKLAMIEVYRWLQAEQLKSHLIMQVHDELVLEVAIDELEQVRARLPQIMSGVMALAVPLEVSVGVGKNWDEAH